MHVVSPPTLDSGMELASAIAASLDSNGTIVVVWAVGAGSKGGGVSGSAVTKLAPGNSLA